MGDVVNLIAGRRAHGKSLPKPVECKDCGDPIETARLQLVPHTKQCISCARAWERRFERQMEGVREHQAVKVIR
jgi:hypothetical protein